MLRYSTEAITVRSFFCFIVFARGFVFLFFWLGPDSRVIHAAMSPSLFTSIARAHAAEDNEVEGLCARLAGSAPRDFGLWALSVTCKVAALRREGDTFFVLSVSISLSFPTASFLGIPDHLCSNLPKTVATLRLLAEPVTPLQAMARVRAALMELTAEIEQHVKALAAGERAPAGRFAIVRMTLRAS